MHTATKETSVQGEEKQLIQLKVSNKSNRIVGHRAYRIVEQIHNAEVLLWKTTRITNHHCIWI